MQDFPTPVIGEWRFYTYEISFRLELPFKLASSGFKRREAERGPIFFGLARSPKCNPKQLSAAIRRATSKRPACLLI